MYDLIIVGSGPAGYTAGIYAARAGLNTLLLQGDEPGGQLMLTTEVENFPGFKSIQGPELMAQMAEHATAMGVQLVVDKIIKVDFSKTHPLLQSTHKTYEARAVIIATGAQAKWLEIPSEKIFRGFGISACATCDGPFFKNKVVGVIGGGNTAVEEALFLTHHAEKVYLIHRRDTLRAEHVLQKRLHQNKKITIMWNHQVKEFYGQASGIKALKGVTLAHTQTQQTQDLKLNGAFIAIGHTPNTKFLEGHLNLDTEGYIQSPASNSHTNVPGVFAAGDVKDKIYRQAITAAGQGCMAALDAEKYLSSQ